MAAQHDADRIAFKQAFLARCREAGMADAEILDFVKAAQGHQRRPAANNQPPTRGITPGNRGFFQEWLNPPKPSSTAGAPTNSPYLNTLDRWYNPWTKQTGREAGEQGLMRAGQTAMGVGAAAGAAAGGLAAAPALSLPALSWPSLGTAGGLTGGAAGLWSLLRGAAAPLARPEVAGALLLGAPIAGGLALGGLGGYAAAKATEPEENEEDIKARELETAYKVQAQRLKARRAYEQYRQSRKTAADKTASWTGLSGALLLGAPIAGGLALGGMGGYAAAKATEPEENEEDIKAREIERAYQVQANRMRARRAYEQYRKNRGV